MPLTILAVGKLKETWQREACAEYLKRMQRYGGIEVIEVADQPEPEKAGEALRRKVTEAEGRELLSRIRPGDRVIALCVNGRAYDSEGFAEQVTRWMGDGRRPVLVIGGSLGLSEEVIRRADETLSFSRMTFPHQLMRVILLEQLYRAHTINAHERYHK